MPRLGDTIGTIGHYWPPQKAVVTLGIQGAQRLMGLKEWRLTHSMAYVGRLDKEMICAAVETGIVDESVACELVQHDDWMLSMTTPVGKWERYASVRGRHVISRPTFCAFHEEWQRRAWQATAWWWIGRRYDIGQLFGILVDVLGEREPKKYSRFLDAGPWRTVCSGAVSSCYEAVRRQGIAAREWQACEIGEWTGGWPRILDGLHLERTAPGHLCLAPWFDTEER